MQWFGNKNTTRKSFLFSLFWMQQLLCEMEILLLGIKLSSATHS